MQARFRADQGRGARLLSTPATRPPASRMRALSTASVVRNAAHVLLGCQRCCEKCLRQSAILLSARTGCSNVRHTHEVSTEYTSLYRCAASVTPIICRRAARVPSKENEWPESSVRSVALRRAHDRALFKAAARARGRGIHASKYRRVLATPSTLCQTHTRARHCTTRPTTHRKRALLCNHQPREKMQAQARSSSAGVRRPPGLAAARRGVLAPSKR